MSLAIPSKIRRATVVIALLSTAVVGAVVLAQAPDPDLNNDGVVSLLDISIVAACFGHDPSAEPECSRADTNGDGVIDFVDLTFVQQSFGQDGFPIETIAPTIEATISPPPNGVGWHRSDVTITFACADDDSGVETCSDPVNVTEETPSLLVTGTAVDRVGNESSANVTVKLDKTSPIVSVSGPADATPGLTVSVSATVTEANTVASVRFFADAVLIGESSSAPFRATFAVPEDAIVGSSITLRAVATDLAGNEGTGETLIPLVEPGDDVTAPTLRITSPRSVVVGDLAPTITLEYSDAGSGIDEASVSVRLDGSSLTCQVESSSATCEPGLLAPGRHIVAAEVSDRAGNSANEELEFTLVSELSPEILEPSSGTLTTTESVRVVTRAPLADTVTVQGFEASRESPDGDTFVAENVPLREGANTLTVIARSDGGGIGTRTVIVVRDTEAPRVVIQSPANGFVTTSSQIPVAGEVVDSSSSSAEAQVPRVLVNGIPAEVTHRSFIVPAFLRQPGDNTIEVVCVDSAGNVGVSSVTVRLVADAVQKLEELAGNNQRARVGQTLPEPLMVRLTNAIGNPIPNRNVTFTVSRGNGAVISFPDASSSLTVPTNEHGVAEVLFALGSRAGAGNHEVVASAPGITGEVVFCASANAAPAIRIKPIAGHVQTGARTGVAGSPLAQPLLSQVFDDFGNPVSGVDVTFEVVEGGGSFGGLPALSVTTDAEGKASANPTLGPVEGVNSQVFSASFTGLFEPPAAFAVSAIVPAAEEETSISGIVLDNQDNPVPSVTVRVADTTLVTTSSADGRFFLGGAPVGTTHLEVLGSTTTRPGTWPTLHFEFPTISGQDNDLGMPIRLLPIDVDGRAVVGGNEDVTIKMSGVPGAELTVLADSVTFPDGSKVGEITFTQVHSDKVPMVAPLGSSFMLAWTVQPAGVRFDPPARVAIPNFGDAPGTNVEMFSFDHDLGEFVSIGPASVTAEGLQVVADPGFGVLKSGWGGCVTTPPPTADACKPGTCSICVDGGRSTVSACSKCEVCTGGGCEPRKLESVTAQAATTMEFESEEIVAAKNKPIRFRAHDLVGNCSASDTKYEWDFGDGNTGEGAETTHEYDETRATPFTVTLTVTCEGCAGAGQVTDEIEVRVFELDIEMQDLPEEDEDPPHEEEPGAYIIVNDDDDNENDTEDVEESATVTDEDDLEELKITVDDALDEGTIRLEAEQGADKIRVWESETKETPVELPKTWDLADGPVPESLWIEGVASSNSLRDVRLVVSYREDGSDEPLVDDTILLTVIDLEFFVFPDEDAAVNADVPRTFIAAQVFYKDFEDPERLKAVEDGAEIEWALVSGPGSLSSSSSTTSNGGTGITLNTTTIPGNEFQVLGRLTSFRIEDDALESDIEIERELETGTLSVIAGPAATINVSSSVDSFRSDETDTATLTATVLDGAGNAVANGTPISWRLDESTIDFVSTVTSTSGGQATAVVQAPIVPVDLTIFVSAGSANASTTIPVVAVGGALTGSPTTLDIDTGGTAVLTASFDAAEGTPVFWTTSNGTLTSSDAFIAGGSASATLDTVGGGIGPVVVTATAGSRFLTWEGEFRTSGDVTAFSERRFIVDGASEDGFEILNRPDGTTSRVGFFATAPLTLQGPANTVVNVGTSGGGGPVEAYTFDSSAGGIVPGVIAGNDMTLSGGNLDPAERMMGAASLFLNAPDSGSVADAPLLDFTSNLRASMWVRPQSIAPATLLGKGDAWALELLADGRVRASISTTGGAFEVTTTETLVPDVWTRVSLDMQPGALRVTANETVSSAITGTLTQNDEPMILGAGFAGHVDELAIIETGGSLTNVQIEGTDAAGRLTLGADGTGTVLVRSLGAELPAGMIFRSVDVVMSGTTTVASLSPAERDALVGDGGSTTAQIVHPFEVRHRLEVLSKELQLLGTDAVLSFFGGDPETNLGIAFNIAGGMLIVGDVGALVKNGWRALGFSEEEVNMPEVILTGLGLLTEIAVGVGEIPDFFISAARAIVARIGDTPLSRMLVARVKRFISAGDEFSDAEKATIDALRNLDGVADSLKNVISEDTWKLVVRVHDELGDGYLLALKRVADNPALGSQVAESVAKSLGDMSDEALAVFKNAGRTDEMVGNLGKVLTKIDSDLATLILNNCGRSKICNGTYTINRLLDDMDVVADVPGFARLADRLKINSAFVNQVRGFRYELQAASDFLRRGADVQFVDLDIVIEITDAAGTVVRSTDIDLVVDGIYYQVKSTQNAFRSLKKIQEWVEKARLASGQLDYSSVAYIVPDTSILRESWKNWLEDPVRDILVTTIKID